PRQVVHARLLIVAGGQVAGLGRCPPPCFGVETIAPRESGWYSAGRCTPSKSAPNSFAEQRPRLGLKRIEFRSLRRPQGLLGRAPGQRIPEGLLPQGRLTQPLPAHGQVEQV